MQFPQCLARPNCDNTYCSVSLAQTWQDLALWEAFLDQHPVASIVELGTWRGGMSLFLGHQMHCRSGVLVTIDSNTCLNQAAERLTMLGVDQLEMDLFAEDSVEHMQVLFSRLPRPLLLF